MRWKTDAFSGVNPASLLVVWAKNPKKFSFAFLFAIKWIMQEINFSTHSSSNAMRLIYVREHGKKVQLERKKFEEFDRKLR